MHNLKIEQTPIHALRPQRQNARTHSRRQIRQIADSIQRFGFCNAILVDDELTILAGHGRVKAAELLNLTSVPTIRLSHLSDADKRAYVIADNRLAEKAGWDRNLLALELQGLIDIGFEIELTAFFYIAVVCTLFVGAALGAAAAKRCLICARVPQGSPFVT